MPTTCSWKLWCRWDPTQGTHRALAYTIIGRTNYSANWQGEMVDEAPSAADFALMGALHAHMGRDPAGLRVMQDNAPPLANMGSIGGMEGDTRALPPWIALVVAGFAEDLVLSVIVALADEAIRVVADDGPIVVAVAGVGGGVAPIGGGHELLGRAGVGGCVRSSPASSPAPRTR